ncbi:hypothetical protein PR048_013038, partial [Dryococelus australis]
MSRALKVREYIIPVIPQQLFMRIICVMKNESDFMTYLKYELALKPPALFDEISKRKIAKSSLAMVLKSCDGTREHQCRLQITVVFDGYEKFTTKGEERRRQSAGRSSTDISIADNNVVMLMQVDFLRNGHNKNGLIKLLVTYFRASGRHAVQCSEDADTTLAAIALQYDTNCGVKVIATDTDILAMLTARTDEDTHIERDIGEMKNYIVFCHIITGSDTTSAFFGKGKKQTWNIVKSDVSIRSTIYVFMRPNADKRDIISTSEKFAMGVTNYATLDELRVYMYTRKIAKLPVSAFFQLAFLTPTSAAREQHSLRVYLQVQEWLGHSLDPVVWGWKSVSGTLVPITTSLLIVATDASVCGLDCSVVLCVPSAMERRTLMLSSTMALMERNFK